MVKSKNKNYDKKSPTKWGKVTLEWNLMIRLRLPVDQAGSQGRGSLSLRGFIFASWLSWRLS